jgi:hypothetical protein
MPFINNNPPPTPFSFLSENVIRHLAFLPFFLLDPLFFFPYTLSVKEK